jgi:S-adenosyl-L-methionine hydrolase (adenosine-forming)
MTIVTLLSDFGERDSYVAQMKGIILNNYPGAVIVDISHGIERHNIPMGSFLLETVVPFFPKGTIHVAVVDPRVGSTRKPVVVKCEMAILVGPDNGLMARASERLGLKAIYEIRKKEFQRTSVSTTFHGRDIFAYTAGLIASGRTPDEAGPRVPSLEKLDLSSPRLSGKELVCQVLHVDTFGNVITSVDEKMVGEIPAKFGEAVEIQSGARKMKAQYARSYYEVSKGAMAVLLGSQGFLEVAAREGSARDNLDVKPLDKLELRF